MYKYHDYYKGLIGLLGVHVHAFGTPRTRLLLSFGMSRIVLSVCICSLSQCFLTIYHDNSQDVLGDLIAWKVITNWPMRPPPPPPYHDNSQDVLGDLIAWKVITIWPMRPPPPPPPPPHIMTTVRTCWGI